MTTHTLRVPALSPWISSNQHTHWRNRHALTADWRNRAGWAAVRAKIPALGEGPVTITATVHRKDRRRFDLDGITPTVKACIDGLRDALVLSEDHSGVITELTIRAGEPRPHPCLILTITETEKP